MHVFCGKLFIIKSLSTLVRQNFSFFQCAKSLKCLRVPSWKIVALYNLLFLQANVLMAKHDTQNNISKIYDSLPHFLIVFLYVDSNDKICYCFPISFKRFWAFIFLSTILKCYLLWWLGINSSKCFNTAMYIWAMH